MRGWLMYHPARTWTDLGSVRVYHDDCSHNQDPYVWSDSFLHTYCHITQMSPQVDDVEFWVSGNRWPDFDELLCDLVFVIKDKCYWAKTNHIDLSDPIVDSAEAFNDHYRWWADHPYKTRTRYTLKAVVDLSFQPQDQKGRLLDVIPALEHLGVSLKTIRTALKIGFAARPMQLDAGVADGLKTWLYTSSAQRLSGSELRKLRLANPQLAS